MPQARLLVDLTTSFAWQGRNAVGIVRTEREIARRLLRDATLTVLPVVFVNGRMTAVPPHRALAVLEGASGDRKPAAAAPIATGASAPRPGRSGWVARVNAGLRKLARGGLRAVPERARADVAAALVHTRAAMRAMVLPRKPAAPAESAADRMASELTQAVGEMIVHPGAGDVLIAMGLGWDHLNWRAIEAAKNTSALGVVCVCYDTIPLKFPEFVGGANQIYTDHFLRLSDLADAIPCISRCTAKDVQEFAALQGRPILNTHVVYLGSDVPAEPDPAQVDVPLRNRLARGRFALSVGIVDLRKNYDLLLDVWDALHADPGFDLDLVLVGMKGGHAEALAKRLEASPLYGRRIHWLHGLGDPALSWLYAECHVMLYPSLYEGWGLPVVEALQHRRPVIASSRGSVPEAGLGLAKIIDPDDTAAWIAAVREAAAAPRTETPPAPIPTWDEAAVAIGRIAQGVATRQASGAS